MKQELCGCGYIIELNESPSLIQKINEKHCAFRLCDRKQTQPVSRKEFEELKEMVKKLEEK